MNTPDTFEDLEAWQRARKLAATVYLLSRREPLNRDFGLLTDQLRRAAVSVMNNLAEGWESIHTAEEKQSYGYARRSCGEVRSMSYLLLDNTFISRDDHTSLRLQCIRTGKLVSGLIRPLHKRQ